MIKNNIDDIDEKLFTPKYHNCHIPLLACHNYFFFFLCYIFRCERSFSTYVNMLMIQINLVCLFILLVAI